MLRVNYTTVSQAALIAFCTVQDNTSFGADFRIAKQVGGHTLFNPGGTPSAKDILAVRDVLIDHDALGRPFVIPPGVYSNTHAVYYRQPDYVMCEIINPATGLRADPPYGLEIRTVDQFENTQGGGNNALALPQSAPTGYMGDKENASNGEGANGRAVIEVEDSETNSAANRPYKLHCRTGSGTKGFDMLRYQELIGRFCAHRHTGLAGQLPRLHRAHRPLARPPPGRLPAASAGLATPYAICAVLLRLADAASAR